MVLLGLGWPLHLVQGGAVGPVVSQGSATVTSQGSHTTIQTSDRAVLNWQSFNIGLGERTSFVQPSASSVVWNRISDPNPTQILGGLDANGFVVLQNSSGFFIGGQATISTHGLVLSTSPTPPPDLSGGGAWQFSAPPPSASIINYGQINVGDRGSAYLIANQVENHGSIAAPQGSVGLYAGKEVLLSTRPDGRGLSASVTLPQGSVDNSGRIIADAGTIEMRAKVVNQGGLVQADSVRNINGVIQLVASEELALGAGSMVSAKGDVQGISSGGSVTIKSSQNFSDQAGSRVDVSGGKQGGAGGQVEISAGVLPPIQTTVIAPAAAGYRGGQLLIDPADLLLSASFVKSLSPSLNGGLYEITLAADNNITLNTVWTLDDPGAAAQLSLTAGNNIIFNNGAGIKAGTHWGVTLAAGQQGLGAAPDPGFNGIYLRGNSFLQTVDGDISLWAANEVIVNPGPAYDNGTGAVGNNGIRTTGGGKISVTTDFGDVNTGGNVNGYLFNVRTAPYYRVSPNAGGISTIAGGDVNISAGGNVISYLPVADNYNGAKFDGGSGAFGSQPGNVSITAGGNVSGHFVVGNGTGTVVAGGDVGSPTASGGFALSLIKGSWSVSAPHGNIYLQDVRNPNGIFNDTGGSVDAFAGYHYFDYDPHASLTLSAAQSVEITGAGAPHTAPSASGTPIPLILPPSLTVNAGAGGFVLDTDVILFPSPVGELHVNTHDKGDFRSFFDPNDPTTLYNYTLSMSDSAAKQWSSSGDVSTFGVNDHAATPAELNNPNPVVISVDGSMRNLTLHTTKATEISVAGDLFNTSFLGQNLHAKDVSSITVGGSISFSPVYAFTHLDQMIKSADPFLPAAWDSIFSFLVDPSVSLQLTPDQLALTPGQLSAYAYSHLRLSLKDGYSLQPGYDTSANPGFIYDATSGQLGYRFKMGSGILAVLGQPAITVLKLDATGNVAIERHADGNYYFATTTTTWVDPVKLASLFTQSQNSVRDYASLSPGFQFGGPGQFNVTAGSLDLGSSGGIISWGVASAYNQVNYDFLKPWTPTGAGVKVEVAGDITLLTSTIASIDGGDVVVKSTGGAVTLSQGDFALIPPGANVSYGIFTSGHSDVKVTADKNVDVGGARIGTFNGGSVTVHSDHGSVNAGNGANSILVIPVIIHDPVTGDVLTSSIGNPAPFGSGILAIVPAGYYQAAAANGLPGDITIETPHGNIISTLGGIQQYALNGSIGGGPKISLTAGTAPSGGSPGYAGNVDLGSSGVIGGAINIKAEGSISGLIVSRQDANIQAAQSFHGTLLAGGTANVSASAGTVSGTIIGVGGVSASGSGGVTAAVLGQNVSIGGGAAQSTLGKSAAGTSTAAAAATQASADSKQQLASETNAADDEEKKKRAAKPQAVLTRRVGRVTVVLPKS